METISCWVCGIVFAVPTEWGQQRHEKHDFFFCPNGHEISFPYESEKERLERLLKQETDQHAITRQEKFALEGSMAKLKNRIKEHEKHIAEIRMEVLHSEIGG